MIKYLAFAVVLIILPIRFYAQIFTGETKAVNLKMEPQYKLTLPPNLYVNMEFSDANGNGIIEAEEKATLTLEIFNKGAGPAQGLSVKLTSLNYDPAFTIGDEIYIRSIEPGQSQKIEIPFIAGLNVKTNEHKIQINVKEHFGYDMDPATLILNTLEYQKSKIVFSGMDIFDQGDGTLSIVADGQLQAGEMIKAKLVFQNIGNNVAENVQYKIVSKDANIVLKGDNDIVSNTISGTIGNMGIGEVKEIWVTLSPNKRVDNTELLPIYLTITEAKGKGNLIEQQLPLALNQRPPKTETLTVKADFDKMKQQIARFEYQSDKYTSNIAYRNIEAVPATKSKRTDAVAIVIGAEDYINMADAPYAAKDAEIITRYFKDALGIDKVFTYTNEEVTGFFFINIFDDKTGQLMKLVNQGETEIFVYYSGHGIPEKDGTEVYLFPTDGKLEMLDVMGYSLNKLYKNLDALQAKSVTVILDACFSGNSRASETQISENLTSAKGTIIRPREVQPWESNPNFRVFTSSKDEQTSLGFDVTGTGLFTYFLASGMQGEADTNADKIITAAELQKFVTEKVVETSRKIRGEQTPQFYGNDDFIIIEF
jgi:hypothetical protein